MKEGTIRAAILDMDGVITQTARLHARAWKRMFDEFLEKRQARADESLAPFDIDKDYRQYVDGKARYDGVRSFLESRHIRVPVGDETDDPRQETICGLGNRKNEIFRQLLKRGGVQVYADAVEQIGNWKRAGLRVAVISASRNCPAVLEAAHLRELFDAQVDGNDMARLELAGKPAPDIFLRAAQEMGVEPRETIIVEDAIAGVLAGRQGGFGMVVGVARQGDGADLREAGAERIVRDLTEISLATGASPAHRGSPPAVGSALENLDQIASLLEGKDVGLFLDYDGTLTPIVSRPEDATLSGEMRALLAELAQLCTVAVVSGRDRRNVQEMVGLGNLVYAGSHGFDIQGPGGLELQQEDAQQALPDVEAAEQQLRARIKSIAGAQVERKKFAVAVHYRNVSGEDDVRRVEEAVDDVIRGCRGLRKRGGKKIYELQPDVPWDKGAAVLWLSEALGMEPSEVLLVYIGDDLTDEDAFRALQRRGVGLGIRVAEPSAETHASWYLRDCREVAEFLRMLLGILQKRQADRP